MEKFPSAKELIKEALIKNPKANLNSLHSLTYELMIKYRDNYYKAKVNDFLIQPSFQNLSVENKNLIKTELLKPVPVKDRSYSNFMEETSRRISQTFQPISGNLAELCVENEIIKVGLVNKVHYLKRKDHTDFAFYYPNIENFSNRHRVEVKNIALRERGTRGLKFDGDSILGFFNEPAEFSKENIKIIDEHCAESDGYCYLPPDTLSEIMQKVHVDRFKSNEEFAGDMKNFVEAGSI